MDRAGEVQVLFWRRTDVAGLERLVLHIAEEAVFVDSSVICVEDGGFQIDHRGRLSSNWQTLSLEVEKRVADERTRLLLERVERGWAVDGIYRPDLDAAEEPDLSVTPFCNSLPIRRLIQERRQSLTLDTCYLDAASMTVELSRQRYERLPSGRVLYVDLGVAAGFEAELQINERGLVTHYQGLFERVIA